MDPFGIDRFVRDFFEDTYPFRSVQPLGSAGRSGQELVTSANIPESRLSLFGNTASSFGRIRLDVTERSNAYQVQAELPGIPKEDIKVTVDNNVLTIEAERKSEKREDNDRVHIVERSYGKFQRSVRLPENCDAENPKANFNNGVLSLEFAKREPSTRKSIQL